MNQLVRMRCDAGRQAHRVGAIPRADLGLSRPGVASLVLWLIVASVVEACGGDTTHPYEGPPATLDAASAIARSGVVGTKLPDPLVVRVTNAEGQPVAGATVTFAITQGNGSISPRVAVTDRVGVASATWVLGTAVGLNEVTTSATPVATPVKFTATPTADAVTAVSISPRATRILTNADSVRLVATSLDKYGNSTSPAATLVVRDPSLLAVGANGYVRAQRRGAATYVVATAGASSDSALVIVLAPGQSICTGVADPTTMVVGQVITDVAAGTVCIRATTAGEQYAIIPYYNSSVPSATTQIEVKGLGLAPAEPSASIATFERIAGVDGTSPVRDDAFDLALRERERDLLTRNMAAARAWRAAQGSLAARAVAVPNVGDLVSYNANALDGCANPTVRTGRVAAVTNKAIVVADTANPPGGFTSDEYRSIGVTFDTLVDPVDVAAFGAPGDIDNNGRAILFFTRAVNALTQRGSGSVVLGFFYGRDLLPKSPPPPSSPCPGSNLAEMFYLLVPDPTGVVSDARSKDQVKTWSNGTVAHEYQHLINASRRTSASAGGATLVEEAWLNEGLSHVAEELNFFRASGLPMRANITGAAINAAPAVKAAYLTFQANNVARFRRYLLATESQSPVGISATDDDLETRGAVWSFLRYAADHRAGGDGTFWYQLVNGGYVGLNNLAHALGTDPAPLFRDWATSVYTDDYAPGVDPRFQQPSWNLRDVMPALGQAGYPLGTRTLSDGVTTGLTLRGGAVAFLQFAVPAGQEALVSTTSSGLPILASMQQTVVRIR